MSIRPTVSTRPIDNDLENQLGSHTGFSAQVSVIEWFKRRKIKRIFAPPKYGDTSTAYWKLYGSEAEINDDNLVKSLKGNTGSMVILNTLFSAIVASFIIEIYKILLPSNDQNATTTDSSRSTAIRINIVLFISFFLSMMSAIGCALIQQWCDEYKKFAHPRTAPHTRGRVRTYLFRGLRVFQMRRFMYGVHALLHISVFLFFWALSDFFYTVDHEFGTLTRYALVGSAVVYILLSVFPLIFTNSPYNTPMTSPLRAAGIILRIIIRSPLWFPRWARGKDFDLTGLKHYKGLHFNRARLYSIEAEKQAKTLEPYAMNWLFTDNDFSDSDMDEFLKGLQGYVSSSYTDKSKLDEYLTAKHIQSRIEQHFITCSTSVELSDQDSIARVSSCVKALLLIFEYSRKRKESSGAPDKLDKLEKELKLQQTYIQGLIDAFHSLCAIDGHTIALRASCIRALAIQGLLSDLVPPYSETTNSSVFPTSLIPIYNYLFLDNAVPQRGNHLTPSAVEMRFKLLLCDGPLANLTKLAQAIRDAENVPPSILPFCWKALHICLTQLGTLHSDEPTHAQSDFETLHKDTQEYVHGEKMNLRMKPLLEVLDIVARGRRLLMVFSVHPEYYTRADVVFGKEYLRNAELLDGFAHCLPAFIAKHSAEECRDFMEKVVTRDDLWTSLQVNLWNTQRSDCPTPDKHRIFDNCCTVLDLTYSVLEDSRKVDWRAPEFGSLSNHFESFITHCFQGAFMGRATSFRVGIIKARFFIALLAQFKDDVDREGTVSFRSQWDVASLARLVCILGFRDKENADFWDSYVNGGHIWANFTAKALEMIDMATWDGPLLIFCQIGHLAVTAVPLDQSGLKPKDMKEVFKLLTTVIESKRLPLKLASNIVWEALGQLQKVVNGLCVKDRIVLMPLLGMIDKIFQLRSSGSMDSGKSEPAVKPFSFSSDSTAVSGGPSGDTQTSEGENGFGASCPDNIPSFHSTIHVTPGVGTVHRSFGTFLSTIPPVIPAHHFQYIGSSQRYKAHNYTSTKRAVTKSSITVPTFATSALFASRSLQGHATSHRSSGYSDEGQLNISPTLEEKVISPSLQ